MSDSFLSLELSENYLKLTTSNITNNIIEVKKLDYYESNFFFLNYSEENTNKLVKEIENFIKKNNIIEKNVNIIIPNNFSYTQIINLPKLTEKELFSAIKLQADKFIPLPIEEINLDLEIIEENKAKNTFSLLLVAASKNLIENIKNIIELSGLIPDSIENEISAISRLITFFKITNILLDINYTSSTLYYFDPQDYLLKEVFNFDIGYEFFLKEYSINKNQPIEMIKSQIANLNPKEIPIFEPIIEGIISNINRFITQVYSKYQFKVEKIFLSNQVLKLPFLASVLQTKTGLNFEIINISPFLKKNNILENYKEQLPLYLATLGGNIK